MAVKSRRFALAFRLISIALIVTGLVRLVGLFGTGWSWSAFVFYTTQSNVVCLIWMLAMAATTTRDIIRDGPQGIPTPWPRLGAAVMMAITVTMLIYLVILAPSTFIQGGEGYQPFTLTDDLIHIVTPCLIIADWFLFSPKGRLRAYDPVLWAILPYCYLFFAFTWPLLGGDFGKGRRYPYPFMDVEANGIGGVALQIAILTVTLIGFGYLYLFADKMIARHHQRAS
ncbi:MAG: Pr6Pr family membrane protein [Propionibacteriaceae bacterium]|jgi:hypothetical protein|nr:Pr6Pr family membrane protein [Propionibacteriaceae bacterium]